MAVPIVIPSFNNPYAEFLSVRKNGEALGPMKRFGKDVRIPLPGESVISDPLEPMRRFSRDVTPPRYTPIYPYGRESLPAPLAAIWKAVPFPDDGSTASRAYRSASSFIPTGMTVNSLR